MKQLPRPWGELKIGAARQSGEGGGVRTEGWAMALVCLDRWKEQEVCLAPSQKVLPEYHR